MHKITFFSWLQETTKELKAVYFQLLYQYPWETLCMLMEGLGKMGSHTVSQRIVKGLGKEDSKGYFQKNMENNKQEQ